MSVPGSGMISAFGSGNRRVPLSQQSQVRCVTLIVTVGAQHSVLQGAAGLGPPLVCGSRIRVVLAAGRTRRGVTAAGHSSPEFLDTAHLKRIQ